MTAAEMARSGSATAGTPRHIPVLVSEVLRWLPPRPAATIVDGTAGLGGHSAALLQRLPGGRLIALDRDPHTLSVARTTLAPWAGRISWHHASYRDLPQILAQLHLPAVDGILLDLGLSSWQLAQPDRGFSFQAEGPLDMRFDPTTASPTAAQLLRRLSLQELTDLFRTYGEERHAARIARRIIDVRRRQPLRTTTDLAALIATTVPGGSRAARLHPATRVFQALRIAVNRELEELQQFLRVAPTLLAPGGRLVIISFHSLEDRAVKHAMQGWARAGAVRLLTPHPVTPSPEEAANNPRARSAKLRACERLPAAPAAQAGLETPPCV